MHESLYASLDARQRTMLVAMGVTRGWPSATARSEPVPAPGGSSAPAAAKAVVALADESITTKTIARSADGARSAVDWPTLQCHVHDCRACTRRQEIALPWFDRCAGQPQADWMVVAEVPQRGHAHEDTTFAGDTGLLLDNMLRALGLRRAAQDVPREQAAYLTLAVKCQGEPTRNPSADEVATCANYLAREVALVRPRVLLALGRWAALALLHAEHSALAHQPLGKLRGQVWRFQGVPVIVSFAPAYLLHKPVEKARAWNDLSLARQIQALGDSGYT